MSVLTVAWMGAGAQPLSSPRVDAGACARCGAPGQLAAVRTVVSTSFTGFDGWVAPCGAGLCAACAWGHTTPELRTAPHLVTRTPATLQGLARAAVHFLLLAGALSADVALVLPLRPGRKHLLSSAVWGRVTVADAQLSWSDADAARLQTLTDLRGRGFGSRMLTEPAPPFQVLRALPREQWQLTMRDWERLAPWRAADSPWLPLAVHVTTPTKETCVQ